jgi:hypothetical protein
MAIAYSWSNGTEEYRMNLVDIDDGALEASTSLMPTDALSISAAIQIWERGTPSFKVDLLSLSGERIVMVLH